VDYPVGQPGAIAIGDLDRDGRPDVVAGSGGAVHIFRNTGGGVLASGADYSVSSSIYAIAIADLDRDGMLDVVTLNSSGTVSLLRGDGAGGLGSPKVATGGGSAIALAV